MTVVSVTSPTLTLAGMNPSDVLDNAASLGTLTSESNLEVPGAISHGTEVDWYSFTLTTASTIDLSVSAGVLSLYNNAENDASDLLILNGHRLLAQSSSADSTPGEIQRQLAAGTYFIAISGGGNLYFNSGIADSGLPGKVADYTLDVNAHALTLDPTNISVLATDVSPLAARFDLSQPLGFTPMIQLVDATGNTIPVQWTNTNSSIFELQVAPKQAFAAGNYRAIVTDASGSVRMTIPFELSASAAGESGVAGSDTPSTAVDLGNIAGQGLVQIPGFIGDDRYYTDSDFAMAPGNDVDMYHFTVASGTTVGLQADVFANRINSLVDVGISLYRKDATGHLVLVAVNNNTSNRTLSTDGSSPLANDSALTTSLTAGDYYVVVSQNANTQTYVGQPVQPDDGIYNPEVAHSGSSGWQVGSYVLNLRTVAIPDPPEVVSTSIVNQSVLPDSPTDFTIQFSELMNLALLANTKYAKTSTSAIDGLYIQDAKGNKYFPRMDDFNPQTFTAHFVILDRLSAGDYVLHLDGALGVGNLTGGPLAGNTSQGDYQVKFNVAKSNGGSAGDPLRWKHDPDSDITNAPQPLGMLFPGELAKGITIQRTPSANGKASADTYDDYSFQITQSQSYRVNLLNGRLPAGVRIQILDASGKVLIDGGPDNVNGFLALIGPGSVTLRIGGWPASDARTIAYQIQFSLITKGDNPPPLYSGPAPAVGLSLFGNFGSGGGGSSGGGGGPGSGGSNPGGSSGGSSGSGGGGGNSSGGISQPISVSPTSSSSISSTYLTSSQDLSRIVMPSLSSGAVIAIPNASGSLADGSGLLFSASRSIRRGSLSGDGLGLTSLSELADGPIGRSNTDDQPETTSVLQAMQRMRALIESSLSPKSTDELADESNRTWTDETDGSTALLRDEESAEHATFDDDLKVDESTAMRSKAIRVTNDDSWADALLPTLRNAEQELLDLNDRAFISTDADEISKRVLETSDTGLTDPTGLFSADTLFASGIGMLLLEGAVRGAKQPLQSNDTIPLGKLSKSRKTKHQPV
jgi:hypothetical protein